MNKIDRDFVEGIISKTEIQKFKKQLFKFAHVKSIIGLKKYLINLDQNEYHKFRLQLIKSDYFADLNKKVKSRLEKKISKNLYKFPVNGVRIAISDNKTHAPWHQDEGTWFHHKKLRNKKPFTIWIPIIANKNNTIEISNKKINLIRHKRNKFNQAYIRENKMWATDTKVINPKIGNGYIFGCLQPHRSFCKSNEGSLRISVDFRFF